MILGVTGSGANLNLWIFFGLLDCVYVYLAGPLTDKHDFGNPKTCFLMCLNTHVFEQMIRVDARYEERYASNY